MAWVCDGYGWGLCPRYKSLHTTVRVNHDVVKFYGGFDCDELALKSIVCFRLTSFSSVTYSVSGECYAPHSQSEVREVGKEKKKRKSSLLFLAPVSPIYISYKTVYVIKSITIANKKYCLLVLLQGVSFVNKMESRQSSSEKKKKKARLKGRGKFIGQSKVSKM